MNNNRYLPDYVALKAKSLGDMGVDEVGWEIKDALEVVQHLNHTPISILGGDMYRDLGGYFRPTGDNWYCQKDPSESHEDFAVRSRNKAIEYLKEMAKVENEKLLAVLVFKPNIYP